MMLNTSASGTRSLRLNMRSAARTGDSVRRGGCFLQHQHSFSWNRDPHVVRSHGRQLARLTQHSSQQLLPLREAADGVQAAHHARIWGQQHSKCLSAATAGPLQMQPAHSISSTASSEVVHPSAGVS